MISTSRFLRNKIIVPRKLICRRDYSDAVMITTILKNVYPVFKDSITSSKFTKQVNLWVS